MSAPLEARLLRAAYAHLTPAARAEVDAGHAGSRIVRAELARIAAVVPLGVTLTRSETRRAIHHIHHGIPKEIAA